MDGYFWVIGECKQHNEQPLANQDWLEILNVWLG